MRYTLHSRPPYGVAWAERIAGQVAGMQGAAEPATATAVIIAEPAGMQVGAVLVHCSAVRMMQTKPRAYSCTTRARARARTHTHVRVWRMAADYTRSLLMCLYVLI
jgi:hypothetical protein